MMKTRLLRFLRGGSIPSRLTAMAAAILMFYNGLWASYSWEHVGIDVDNEAYRRASQAANNIDIALPQLGYANDRMPLPGTDAYWQLKCDLAYEVFAAGPYFIRYHDGDTPVCVPAPLLLWTVDDTEEAPPVSVDLSELPESAIREMHEQMTHPSAEWQGNSPYFTVYGTMLHDKFFVPNRVVSCMDEKTWQSPVQVPEAASLCVPFSNLFADDGEMERYFSALRHVKSWATGGLSAYAVQKDFRAVFIGNGARDLYLAYPYDRAGEIWSELNGVLSASILFSVLFLCVFYYRVRRMVSERLWDTAEQVDRLSRLEFDKFQPDTARRDEIGALNGRLRAVAGQLQARWDDERDLEKRRQDFVAAASHDLKTPLALISGYTEAIAQDISPEENARYLASIERETARMNALVLEMLDYTRLDRMEQLADVHAFGLAPIIQSALDEMAPLLAKKRVQTALDPAIRIRGDQTLLRRAIGNLLENAAKFTPDGGQITVTLSRQGGLFLAVENEGAPIPEDDLPRVFDMFYRGDKARDRSGHGLGLAITQKILSLHGLCCRAENTETGVRFVVEYQ